MTRSFGLGVEDGSRHDLDDEKHGRSNGDGNGPPAGDLIGELYW
jgi:hypothetical protein